MATGGRKRRAGTRRGRDGNINVGYYAPTKIPGVYTSISDREQGTYPFPGFGYPAVSKLPRQVPGALQGQHPSTSSQEALARDMGLAFPPNKRPRGSPPSYQPSNPQSRGPGRGITPSFLVNAALAAQQAQAQWTPGMRTGDFSSIARLVQAAKGELEFALYLKNQLVFNYKPGYLENDTADFIKPISARFTGRHIPTAIGGRRDYKGSHRLLSLPALNYYLRLGDTRRNDAAIGKTGWLTPHQVLQQYSLDGIVRTDAHEADHPAYRKTNSKVYTVTIDGRQPDITNIWGAVKKHQRVYILVTRLPKDRVPTEYQTNPYDSSRRTIPTHANGAAIEYHPNPIQAIPWANYEKWEPTAEDLRYYDETLGDWCQGVAICVGYANYPSIASNEASVKQAWYNAKTLMDLPMMDVTVNMYYGRDSR